MATIATQAATVVGVYGYPGLQPELRQNKEKASQTFKIGAFLADDTAGFLRQHTADNDASIVGDLELPTAKLRSVKAPTLVVYGSESPAFMGNAAKALAKALPDGHVRALDGQSHDIVPAALAPVLLEFFAATPHA